MKNALASAIILVLAAACGPATTGDVTATPPGQTTAGAPDTAAPAPAPAEAPAPPALRLPETVQPIGYYLELAVDPAADTTDGMVTIDLALGEPTRFLWMHGTDLEIGKAMVSAGGEEWAVETLPTSNEHFLGFDLGRAVPKGGARITIWYTGKILDKDIQGLFKQQDGDHWYTFTQLEAYSARKVVPSFDEPRFKTPWQLVLHVRPGHEAFANTPETGRETNKKDGFETVTFAETKPIPSYLLAFAVGPFETVDVGPVGRDEAPARIIVPRGRTAQARYAAKVTPKIVELLEDYFDMAYPYAKLDSIAIPRFPGAMENPGLITYSSSLLLSDPDKETDRFHVYYAAVGAHEIAHQWFGNLVTLAWWNDIWLNEAFATWAGAKVIAQWKPEWDLDVHAVGEIDEAMAADSLVTARRIRNPIENHGDINGAFDAITYEKGGAVLSMFERWVGEEAFRSGVRAYLKEHAWGTATSEDFLAALSAASKPEMAEAFTTFLEQPGIPLVSVELACAKGETPSLAVTQRRFLPTGSKGSTEQTWHIPMCARYDAGRGKTGVTCQLITEEAATLELTEAKRCPTWVLPNADAAGYYRVAYGEGLLDKLFDKGMRKLSVAEQVSVVADMSALVRTGKIEIGEALAQVPRLVAAKSDHITSAAVGIVAGVDANVVPEKLRPRYARFVRKMFGPTALELGWKTRKSDTPETKQLRSELVPLVAIEGEDARLAGQARKLTARWLETREGIDAEVLSAVLGTAARRGDAKLHERFREALEATDDPNEKRAIIAAMAQFTDEALVEKNLELFVSGDLGLRESAPLIGAPLDNLETRELAYQFLKDNYDAIAEKLPKMAHGYLVASAAVFCDREHIDDAVKFFTPKMKDVPNGDKALAQTVEQIELCIAFRDAQQPSVEAFLRRQ